jgi:hypothetical protein
MSERIRNLFMTEETLAGVESAVSLLFAEGIDWPVVCARPDLMDACQMVREALTEMRYPLPVAVQHIPTTDEL